MRVGDSHPAYPNGVGAGGGLDQYQRHAADGATRRRWCRALGVSVGMETMSGKEEPDRQGEQGQLTAAPTLLALFDVLGFSARLDRDGLPSVLSTYRNLIETAVLEPARRCLGTVLTPEGRVMTLFVLPVRYAYFSDTILLWVPLERVFAAAFVTRCADLMCEALMMGVPLRGAISIGEAVMHQSTNTYIGKPLAEAAQLEKGQGWLGIAFAHSATWAPFVAELDGPSLIEYAVPMKPNYVDFASPVVVDWPRAWRDKYSGSPQDALAALNTDSRFARYYENAMEFANHSEVHHDWWKHPETISPDAKLRLVPYSEIQNAKPA